MENREIVIILVKNSKGQLYVNKRRKDKKLYPGYFGLGAGGRIEKGETHKEAAQRELFEELKTHSPIRYLFKYKFKEFGTNQYIYETTINNQILNCDDEWEWSGWMDKEDVDKILADNKFAPDTAITYKKYIGYLNSE